jgi:branched-chain amino acid transport system ATP-binding protein
VTRLPAARAARAMLEVRNLVKSFDGFQAVGGVSLTVPARSISAIIGPNGAGKTTLFNLITGHLTPDRGHVVLKGREITGIAPHDLCRLGVGRSFQRTNIFPRLTVLQNIQAAFVSHRGRGWNLFAPVDPLYRDESEGLLAAVGLLDQADETSGFLSHGAQKQLELGIALALEPDLLLLDEPTAGMSATETREAIALIERLARERNLTLLFTEHDMEVVFSISQRITVLHQGRVIADGAPEDVRRDPDVRRVYLGEKHG